MFTVLLNGLHKTSLSNTVSSVSNLYTFSKLKSTESVRSPTQNNLKPPPPFIKRVSNTTTSGQNQKISPKLPNLPNLMQNAKNIGPSFKMQEAKQQEMPTLRKKHPVVTIMGHVDHGKTTLIDYLRHSDIAEKQDGGITQRISAFRINCQGQRITFIDTPGHQAFINMRQRGASLTDIVVLVVSAVEGVKTQTLEVIEILKKNQIPFIVAINKIDLPEANPENVQQQLQKVGINLQINGGNVPSVHISAKTGINVELLCQLIIQQTKNGVAIFDGMAQANVLEALQNKQKMNSMTIVMKKGTLKNNSVLIVGNQFCKVRSILDDRGEPLKEAYPGEAVQIVGIPFIPAPGDQIIQVQSLDKAKFIVDKAKNQIRVKKQNSGEIKNIEQVKIKFDRTTREGRKQRRVFYKNIQQVWMIKLNEEQDKLLAQLQQLKKKQGNPVIDEAIFQIELKLENHKLYVAEYLKKQGDNPDIMNIMMKFGDRGMEETILMQLQKLKKVLQEQSKIKLNLIKSDVGAVSVSDLEQAATCGCKIFTFGAEISQQARNFINLSESIEAPRVHKLIHTLLKDLKESSQQKKLNFIKGTSRAKCDVLDLFTVKVQRKDCMVPGIKVTSGKITKNCKAYVFRNGLPVSITPYDIQFIKSFKKQMVQLKKGEEGTIGLGQDIIGSIAKGDELHFYEEM